MSDETLRAAIDAWLDATGWDDATCSTPEMKEARATVMRPRAERAVLALASHLRPAAGDRSVGSGLRHEIEVRIVGSHARLFVNGFGCASWEAEGRHTSDLTGWEYAQEVARCIRVALATNAAGREEEPAFSTVREHTPVPLHVARNAIDAPDQWILFGPNGRAARVSRHRSTREEIRYVPHARIQPLQTELERMKAEIHGDGREGDTAEQRVRAWVGQRGLGVASKTPPRPLGEMEIQSLTTLVRRYTLSHHGRLKRELGILESMIGRPENDFRPLPLLLDDVLTRARAECADAHSHIESLQKALRFYVDKENGEVARTALDANLAPYPVPNTIPAPPNEGDNAVETPSEPPPSRLRLGAVPEPVSETAERVARLEEKLAEARATLAFYADGHEDEGKRAQATLQAIQTEVTDAS